MSLETKNSLDMVRDEQLHAIDVERKATNHQIARIKEMVNKTTETRTTKRSTIHGRTIRLEMVMEVEIAHSLFRRLEDPCM